MLSSQFISIAKCKIVWIYYVCGMIAQWICTHIVYLNRNVWIFLHHSIFLLLRGRDQTSALSWKQHSNNSNLNLDNALQYLKCIGRREGAAAGPTDAIYLPSVQAGPASHHPSSSFPSPPTTLFFLLLPIRAARAQAIWKIPKARTLRVRTWYQRASLFGAVWYVCRKTWGFGERNR